MKAGTLAALAGGLLLLAGCSSGTQGAEGAPTTTRNLITREQIEQAQARTAYEVVNRLQPHWLRVRSRGAGQPDPVRVYVDGLLRGDTDQLRFLDATTVAEIRHMNSADATTRFGTGHTSGAILVTTRR